MRRVKGTTLVESIIGMAILAAVSLFAYTGISAGANLIQNKGADRMRAREAAEERLESARSAGGESVRLRVTILDAQGTTRTEFIEAQRISGADEEETVCLYGYLPEEQP
ncbi:MAG: type II secretion system protein [Ruminococcus sp.]|nr:type II secretion system protein [Ruminococcus sp.]